SHFFQLHELRRRRVLKETYGSYQETGNQAPTTSRQAAASSIEHLLHLGKENVVVDEAEPECHQQLQNLYNSTKATKVSEPIRALINGAPLEDVRHSLIVAEVLRR
ncbi:hypothetical protein CUMW_149370, partial [Citrus unshiu]